jgi:hypothetical protein
VVQSLTTLSLVLALPLGVRLTDQHVGRRELLGAVGVIAGIVLFLAAGTPAGGTSNPSAAAWWSAGLVAVVIVGAVAALGRTRHGAARAALFGAAAGVGFALQAAVTKVFVGELGNGVAALLTTWSTYVLIVSALVASCSSNQPSRPGCSRRQWPRATPRRSCSACSSGSRSSTSHSRTETLGSRPLGSSPPRQRPKFTSDANSRRITARNHISVAASSPVATSACRHEDVEVRRNVRCDFRLAFARRCLGELSVHGTSRNGSYCRLHGMTLVPGIAPARSASLTSAELATLQRLWQIAGWTAVSGYGSALLAIAAASDSMLADWLRCVDFDNASSVRDAVEALLQWRPRTFA